MVWWFGLCRESAEVRRNMREIIEVYGKAIVSIVIAGLLLTMLFCGISDESGNQGIFGIAAKELEWEQEESAPEFHTYRMESGKEPPRFTLSFSGYCAVGHYEAADLIRAEDCEGNGLSVRVTVVRDPEGSEQGTELLFSRPGIYEISVYAVDAGNRKSEGIIKIPVNRG